MCATSRRGAGTVQPTVAMRMPGQQGGRTVLTGTAAGGDLQSVAQIVQPACALVDGVADIPFGYGIADTDVHAMAPGLCGQWLNYR
jgi:hypothetical protein